MSDTARRGVPVRFSILAGGTSASAVVDLAEKLIPLVEAHLTDEELRAREGLPVTDDYDWGYPEEDADTSDTAKTNETADSTDSADNSETAEPSESSQSADDENQASAPAPTPPSEAAAVPEKPNFKEVLVPIAPGLDPEEARRDMIARLKGPLPAKTDVIMQTSGSQTKNGHLVALSAAALVSSARSTTARLGRPGRWILALPVHHIAGLQVLTRSILAGTKPVIVDTTNGFKPENLVRAVERATADPEIPAYISLVPTQISKILDTGGAPVEALAKLRAILVGGSAFTPFLSDRAKASGWNVVETYGMTETCGGCVYDGIPLVGTQVSTVGEQVWITGTAMMEDYLEKPAGGSTESPWVQMGPRRWFKTSDTGRMEGSRLIIQGRTDDVINTGGVKVHASAVEEASMAVAGVGEVCVVGLPDARWGELVTAVVVPGADIDIDLLAPMMGSPASLGVRGAGGATTEPDSLAARIRTNVTAELGAAHAPRVIAVVQHLPKLDSGKIDRHEVSQIAVRELRAGRAWVR